MRGRKVIRDAGFWPRRKGQCETHLPVPHHPHAELPRGIAAEEFEAGDIREM